MLSTIYYPLSTLYYLLSTIYYLLLTIYYSLSIHYLLSTIYYLLSIIYLIFIYLILHGGNKKKLPILFFNPSAILSQFFSVRFFGGVLVVAPPLLSVRSSCGYGAATHKYSMAAKHCSTVLEPCHHWRQVYFLMTRYSIVYTSKTSTCAVMTPWRRGLLQP